MTEKNKQQAGEECRILPFGILRVNSQAQDKLSNKEYQSEGEPRTKEEKAQATSAREKIQRRIVCKSLARQDIRKAI